MTDTSASFKPLTGGCACGRLRYRVTRPWLVVHSCHCLHCQRENGAAFATNAFIEARYVELLPPATSSTTSISDELSKLSISKTANPDSSGGDVSCKDPEAKTDGEPIAPKTVLVPSESGKGQSMSRCPRCFTCVWSNYSGNGPLARAVRVGTLDEPWKVMPDVHIYTESKHPAVILPEDGAEIDDGNGGKKKVRLFKRFYPVPEIWSKESLARMGEIKDEVAAWKEAGAKMEGSKI